MIHLPKSEFNLVFRIQNEEYFSVREYVQKSTIGIFCTIRAALVFYNTLAQE